MIRQIVHIAFGDDTDTDQELIESIDWDKELGSVTLSFARGATEVIKALQNNESLYAQSSEGIYRVQYYCPFRFLVPEASAEISRITLGLRLVTFHPGQFLVMVE